MQPVKTLIALEDGIDSAAVSAALPGGQDIQIVGMVDGLEEGWEAIQETPSDLIVIACDGNSDRALFLIDGAVKQRPDRPVVVLYSGSPNGFVRRVFEAGADDIVGLPQDPENVRFAIEKAMARRLGGASGTSVATAPMICVLGPKGGTGKTLTTCNLGVALASEGHRVVVVDLDLQFGDVGLALGVAPERTIYDLVKSGGTLDSEKLDGYLMTHSSGLRVLSAPTRPDQAAAVTVPFLRDVYAMLRASFEYLIVDTPPGFTPEVIASIDNSSHVCMVGMLDSLSLKNTKLGLETLELMGYSKERISIVLNRADSRVGISRDDVAAILGRAPDAMVPSDRDIARAVNDGTPLVMSKPRSAASIAFRQLASQLSAPAPSTEKKSRKLTLRRAG